MAARSRELRFGAFRLDLQSGLLSAGDVPVALQPRPLAVLRYLAERPGRVVSGDELLRAVWPGTAVTRGVLKVAVRAVREALGDDAARPRYVETVGRQGYRFLADPTPDAAPCRAMVGREADLERLRGLQRESLDGSRRIVLIAGEAGIGKTTLLDHLLGELREESGVEVARGQCLERHGEGEPYLPVLEALGSLCRDGRADWLVAALRRLAPSWIDELRGLADDETRALHAAGRDGRSTPERMLRELADALAAATAERPLVLALEDLHWSDHATLDLVACLAHRREPAQLLVVGTYRPSDVIVYGHPLRDVKQQLLAKSLCEELVLEPLAPDDVADYLRLRLGDAAELGGLASALHRRTAGNPLFVTSVVDDLITNALLVREDEHWRLAAGVDDATDTLPAGVQQLIEQQADRLPDEDRRLLEAASAAGVEFAVASVAAALGREGDEVEERCEALAARGQFLEPAGLAHWPDGTLGGRYRFLHPLRSHVLYRRVAEPRRVRLHRAIAAREEAGFGARASEIAAELAAHFERGHVWDRAVHFHEAAAHTALRRTAPREATAHFERAIALLGQLPASRARDEAELALRVALAAPLMALRGYAAPEVGASYQRARALCHALGAGREMLPVLRGLASHHQVRAELGVAHSLGEELLARAEAADDPLARVQAHYGHGVTLFHAGEPAAALGHLERGLALYQRSRHAAHARLYGGYDPGVGCGMWSAWALQALGRSEEARAAADEALALAEVLDHPLTLTFALYGVALVRRRLGEAADALRRVERSAALAEEYGFAYELALATMRRGWWLAQDGRVAEGAAALRDGLEGYAAASADTGIGQRILLGAAELRGGRSDDAHAVVLAVLDEIGKRAPELDSVELACGMARVLVALAARRTGGARGSLDDAAAALFRSGLTRAREKGARALELLAAIGLARLALARGEAEEVRPLLGDLVARMPDGFEPRLVRYAERLLREASR